MAASSSSTSQYSPQVSRVSDVVAYQGQRHWMITICEVQPWGVRARKYGCRRRSQSQQQPKSICTSWSTQTGTNDPHLSPLVGPRDQTRSWCPQTSPWRAWLFSACLKEAPGADPPYWRTPSAGWPQHPGRHRSNAGPPAGLYPGAPGTSSNGQRWLTSWRTEKMRIHDL